MRKILIGLLAVFLLAGCEAQTSVSLAELYDRAAVSEIQITYMDYGPDAKSVLSADETDFSLLLNAVFSATASKTVATAYSPEMNATHKLSLHSATDQVMIAYYAANTKLMSVVTYRPDSNKANVLTFLMYEAELSTILNALEGEATAPLEPIDEEPVVQAGTELAGEIVAEDLAKEGTSIDYETFEYPTRIDEPFYDVQLYTDGVAGLENGYLLAVAAWGERPAQGYAIDIKDVIENDDYYVVHVEREAPASDSGDPSYPVAAALIDARRMSGHKLIVFVGENGEMLNAVRIDRDFFQNLPDDMPPLVDYDPMEAGESSEGGADSGAPQEAD